MAQVFVSYKSDNRERLRPLVAALEAAGLSIWWDANITGGAAWRDSIQQELQAAEIVMVIWSSGSIGSGGHFVRDEASWALERGVYLPVLIDELRLPIGFGEVQALSLIGWKGDSSDARFQALLHAIRLRLSAPAPAPHLPHRRPRFTRRVLLTGSAAAALAGSAMLLWKFRPRIRGIDSNGIAVLPFANLSNDPAQEYFAAGLAEELRDALRKIAGLKVIGRISCEQVKDMPPSEAALKLSVDNILTGSVRHSDTHLRVSSQLLAGGQELWSQTFDRPPGDAVEIQSGIAESIASTLRIRLAPEIRFALGVGGTLNAQAHDMTLRAKELYAQEDSDEATQKVLKLAEAAIQLDPQYYEPRYLRSSVLESLAGIAHSSQDALQLSAEAQTEIRRAIAIAPGLSKGYAALATILSGDLDFHGTLENFKRATQLADDDPVTLGNYGGYLAGIGHSRDGVEMASRAVRLDPLNASTHAGLGTALFFARRYREAADSYQHALQMTPNRTQIRVNLGFDFLLMNQLGEASAAFAVAPADDIMGLTGHAIMAARRHDKSLAMAKLARLREEYQDAASAQEAEVYAQLGDFDEAFAALERGISIKDPGLSQIPADPWLDPIRTDPRFVALLKRLNFP